MPAMRSRRFIALPPQAETTMVNFAGRTVAQQWRVNRCAGAL
jgi:hypothetical protein